MNNDQLDNLNQLFKETSLNNNHDINYIDLSIFNINELSETINHTLYYNTSFNPLILLTKDVINDIHMLTCVNQVTNNLYNFVLSKCALIQTIDNVIILYYPLKENIDDDINYNHLSIYYVGEVLYNLRLHKSLSNFQIENIHSDIINQINTFVHNNKYNIITSYQYVNTIIQFNNKTSIELIPYYFILWIYFLMKIRQDYLHNANIIDFDEQIIDRDVICNIYKKLQINLQIIFDEIKK